MKNIFKIIIILGIINIVLQNYGQCQQKGISIKNDVELFEFKADNTKIIGTLNINEEFIILERDKEKTVYKNNNNYWYRINLKNGSICWIFGEYIKRVKGSDLDWNEIYNSSGYDSEEYNEYFPFEVFPRETVILYRNKELTEFYNLCKSDISSIEITGRREKGFPIFADYGTDKSCYGFIEVFIAKIVLSDWGKRTLNKYSGSLNGYIIAEDIMLKNNILVSPCKQFKICKSDRIGCSFDLYNINSYNLINSGGDIFLGYNSIFYWGPKDDYLIVCGWNRFGNYETVVYDARNFNIVNAVLKSEFRLRSPCWVLEKKRIYMRTFDYDDSIYLIDLNTNNVSKIYSYKNEIDEEIESSDGDDAMIWPPVSYNIKDNSITGIFSRRKSGITKKYIVTINDKGDVLSKTVK